MTWTPATDGDPGGDAGDAAVPGLADPAAQSAVAGLGEALAVVAGCEPWRLPDEDLAALVQVSEVAQRRLLMVQVAATVEAGKRGLPARAGFGPGRGVHGEAALLGAWLRSLVNVTRGEARHRAEVGAALFTDPVAADLAETRAAALSGQVTSRHVSAIASAVVKLSPPVTPVDVVDVVDDETRADAQRLLAEQAAVLDPTQTTILAARTLAVLDPGAGDRLAHDEDLRDLQRGITFTPDGTGLVHVRGTLTPVCAGLLATAIDADAAPRPAADGTPDHRTPAPRRHDGLQQVLQRVVAADGLLPSTHGSPYRLVVTVPHTTLLAHLNHRSHATPMSGTSGADGGQAFYPADTTADTTTDPAAAADAAADADADAANGADAGDWDAVPGPVPPGLLPDGWPLSPLTAQVLACSADLVPVLVDDHHQPLDVGDTQYPFPTKIRTAIITRDRGCTYPGCGAPAPWCDTHHLTKFRDGGSTSVDNGALLCGRHHRYVHALGLQGSVSTRDGTSHVVWDHRPTSWTATTATQTMHAAGRARPGDSPGGSPPPLTDPALDELQRRWIRRMTQNSSRAA
jgi:hypothetical protein